MGNTPQPADERSSDEREIGWGDESLLGDEEDESVARLLEDLPPHHVER